MYFVLALVRIIHIQFLYQKRYSMKIAIYNYAAIISFMLLSLSLVKNEEPYAFKLCIISCCLQSATHAFGESVLLGFFKFFPSDAVSMFASGTGFSYIIGLLMILTAEKMQMFNYKVSFYFTEL